jgi:hypothetical protein
MTEAPNWRTSTYTKDDNCVEVADNDPEMVKVRDSKARHRGSLGVRPASWAGFVNFAKKLPL